MSVRGRAFFDHYVTGSLNDPFLLTLGMSTHVFNLTSAAYAVQIPVSEMIEEVGPLAGALGAARTTGRP